MNRVQAVWQKEWQQALNSPEIWLQIALLGASSMALTFFAGHFFDAGRADLAPWFAWLPLSLILFVPVLAANLWVREFETGTLDLVWAGERLSYRLAIGKWLAASAMGAAGLMFVLPLWGAISWLGTPDQGALLVGFLGALLMVSALAALALSASAMASNTPQATLLGILLALVLFLPVLGPLLPFVPPALAEAVAGFSILARFTSFSRGLLSLADVLFLITLSAFGVWVSAQIVMARYEGFSSKRSLQILAVGAAFVAFNLALPKVVAKMQLDMTQGQIYSLSPQGKKILGDMPTEQRWIFYYSSSLAAQFPDIRQFGAQVREMLGTFESHSRGQLKVYERNVLPDSDLEEAAIAAGIEPLLTDTGEPLYFGLANQNGVLVAHFKPQRAALLEYDLLRNLSPSLRNKTKLSLLDETDMAGRDWYVSGQKETALYRELIQKFELQNSGKSDKTPLWMMVHPQALSQQDTQALQRALTDERDFTLILLVDPYREGAAVSGLNGLPRPGAKPSSDLPPAIAALGVQLQPEMVVADPKFAAMISVQEDKKLRTEAYPLWLQLPSSQVVLQGPLATASQRGLVLASAGSFLVNPVANWKFQPILVSSEQALNVPMQMVANDIKTSQLLTKGTNPGSKILAGLLRNDAGTKQILLIADTDFMDERFYGQNDPVFGWQELTDNGRFLLTAMQILSGSKQLINLPPKNQTNRPLKRIEKMRAQAEQKLNIEETRLVALEKQEANTQERAKIRRELRKIRKSFRSQIVWIERALILINVIVFPLGFALFGLFRRRGAITRPNG